MHITYFQLVIALKTGGPLETPKAVFSVVNRVEREDGSGHSFNVTGVTGSGQTVTVHVRTID